jgi:hypothetical protein
MNKKNIIIFILLVVIIVLICLFAGFHFGGANEEKTESDAEIVEDMAKKYMKAYGKLDSKTILKLMYKEQAEDYEVLLERSFEYLDDEDFQIKEWEIIDVSEPTETKLEKIQDKFEDEYDVKIKKVIRVKVKVKEKVDGKTDTEKEELYFGKIKDKWYLLGY